jgi:hypothetical protein
MEQTVQQSYDEKLDPPVVLYAPDGRTRKIDDPRLETTLAKSGWQRKPYPPAIPEQDKGDYGQQIVQLSFVIEELRRVQNELEDRIAALEIELGAIKKTKGK